LQRSAASLHSKTPSAAIVSAVCGGLSCSRGPVRAARAVILHPVDQRAGPPLYISSAYGLTKAMKTAAAPVQTNVCVTFSPTQPVRRGSAARLAPSYIKVLERDNTPRTFDKTKTKVCRDVSFGFDARGHGAVHISQPPAPLYNSALDPHNTRATGDSCACASRSARQRMLSP